MPLKLDIGFMMSLIVVNTLKMCRQDIYSYKVFNGGNNTVESGISYYSKYTMLAIIIAFTVIGGYVLLKKYWAE